MSGKLCATFLLVSLLAACATAPEHKEPPINQPSASLRISTNHSGAMSSNLFLVCDQLPCDQAQPHAHQLAAFSWAHGRERTTRLAADLKVFVTAMHALHSGKGVGGGMVEMSATTCKNTISFVPVAGEVYQLQQRLSSAGCTIELKDSTGSEPSSVSMH
jgi:hypothetical protein